MKNTAKGRQGRFIEPSVTQQIQEKLLEHDQHFAAIEARLFSMDQRMDSFVTRVEFNTAIDSIMTTMDGMMVILQRLDQERVFTVS